MNVLRKDDSTIITKPEKGKGSVILNEPDYLSKMKQLILIAKGFKKLTHNLTISREDSLTSYLHKLKRDKVIDDATLQNMMSFMAFLRFINLVARFALFFLM